MRRLHPLLLLVAPLLLVALLVVGVLWQQHAAVPAGAPAGAGAADIAPGRPAFLPPEAVATLAAIARGGPYTYRQDGVVFGNYEHLLPPQPRGYYHEYTVPTPGARNRGARRIITGGTPPTVYYYTDDHYRSFRRFGGRQ